jgi:Fe2+ transport system protein FeoA
VTIVRLGHTELALERELASEIIVDQVKQGD